MLKIAICDDESEYRATLHGYILQMLAKSIDSVEMTLFSNGSDLLKNYPENLDILLLDIMMPGETGLEIAKKIRTFDKKVQIVFITMMPQYALECYKVHAFGYLLKPLSYNSFHIQMFELIQHIVNEKSSGVLLKEGSATKVIAYKQILYIETDAKHLLIHTMDETVSYVGTMAKMEEQLSVYGFVRCHHSYLVNLAHIRRIDQNYILLSDNSRIPISRNKKNQCLRSLNLYIGEYI
jgi:two-component system, LytTR family, response regulator LytT